MELKCSFCGCSRRSTHQWTCVVNITESWRQYRAGRKDGLLMQCPRSLHPYYRMGWRRGLELNAYKSSLYGTHIRAYRATQRWLKTNLGAQH